MLHMLCCKIWGEKIYQGYHSICIFFISFLLNFSCRIQSVTFLLTIFLAVGFFSISNVWVWNIDNSFEKESFQHPYHSFYNQFFNGYDNATLEILLSVPSTHSSTNILREDILSVVFQFNHLIQETFLKYDDIPKHFLKQLKTSSSFTNHNNSFWKFHPFCYPTFKSKQCFETNEAFVEMLLKTKSSYLQQDSFSQNFLDLPIVKDFIILNENDNLFFFSIFSSLDGIKTHTCQPNYTKTMMQFIQTKSLSQNVLRSLETKLKWSGKKKTFSCIYYAKAIRLTYTLQSHQNILNHLWFRKILSLLNNSSTWGPLQVHFRGFTISTHWISSLYYDMIFLCSVFFFTLVCSACLHYFSFVGIDQLQRIIISFLSVALPLLSVLTGFGLCIWLKYSLFPTSILSAFLIFFLSLHHTMIVYDKISSMNETLDNNLTLYQNLIQHSVQNHFIKTFHLTLLLLSLSWKASPIIKSFCFYFLAGSWMNFIFFTILFLPFFVIQIKEINQSCSSHVTRKNILLFSFYSYLNKLYVRILILIMVTACFFFFLYKGYQNFQIDFRKESMSYNSNSHLVKKIKNYSYFSSTTEPTNIMFLEYPTSSWWTQHFREFVNHFHHALLDFNVACSVENPLKMISDNVKYKTWMTSGRRSIFESTLYKVLYESNDFNQRYQDHFKWSHSHLIAWKLVFQPPLFTSHKKRHEWFHQLNYFIQHYTQAYPNVPSFVTSTENTLIEIRQPIKRPNHSDPNQLLIIPYNSWLYLHEIYTDFSNCWFLFFLTFLHCITSNIIVSFKLCLYCIFACFFLTAFLCFLKISINTVIFSWMFLAVFFLILPFKVFFLNHNHHKQLVNQTPSNKATFHYNVQYFCIYHIIVINSLLPLYFCHLEIIKAFTLIFLWTHVLTFMSMFLVFPCIMDLSLVY